MDDLVGMQAIPDRNIIRHKAAKLGIQIWQSRDGEVFRFSYRGQRYVAYTLLGLEELIDDLLDPSYRLREARADREFESNYQ